MRPGDAVVAAVRLLAGLALVVGVPVALVIGIGWPLPRELPSTDAVREVLASEGVPPEVMMETLAVIVWVAWAQLTLAVVLEAAAAIKGYQASRAPLLPGVQVLAGQIVAASALLVSLLGPLRQATAEAGGPLGVAQLELVAGPQTLALPAAPSEQSPTEADDDDAYVVRRGDSYWAIAARGLEDGMRWREIRDLNVGRRMPDGHVITSDDTLLRPGWRILLRPDTRATTPAPQSPASSQEIEDTYVVVAGDHFWRIAEARLAQQLGRAPTDAEIVPYWRALIAVNEGRYRSGEADLIYPGEVLVVPEGAGAAPAADPPRDEQDPHPDAGDAGREDMAPAERESSVEEIAPEIEQRTTAEGSAEPHGPPVTTPVGRADDQTDHPGGDEAHESLPEPESAPPLPAPPPTAPTPDTSAPPPTPPSAAGGEEADVTDRDLDYSDDEGEGAGGSAVPIGVGLLGAAGSGLAALLLRSARRRRARRVAQLPLDVVPPPPPRHVQPLQRDMLIASDEEAVDRVDAALAQLASGLRPSSGDCPGPRLVQVTGARVEVLLERPHPSPPSPWRPEVSGLIWVLAEDAQLEASAAPSPLPALVTVGVGPSTILVDLEAYGVVALSGHPPAARGLARSMVTELSARTDGAVAVEIIGLELSASVGQLDGVRVVRDWEEIDLDGIETRRAALDAGRWPHAFAARASGRGFDGWTPTVWVAEPSEHPAYQETLAALARGRRGGSAVVVVGEDVGHGLQILLDDAGNFRIPELDLAGSAQMLSDDTLEDVVELLRDVDGEPSAGEGERASVVDDAPADASAADPQPASEAEDGGRHLSVAVGGAEHGTYTDPSFEVVVRVCGEIRVEGDHGLATHTLTPRETAVAAYVALNGEVSRDDIRDAVWAARPNVPPKTIANVIAAVRRKVGDALQLRDDGRWGSGPGLTTDAELMRRRLSYARHQADPKAQIATLRGALDWVTGRVCNYPRKPRTKDYWTWIDTEHWISHIDSVVGSVACELARLCLAEGDGDGACWAARTGLVATGPREELTLLLVAGYELSGDEAAARAALGEYQNHMDELDIDECSTELAEALERHRPRRRAAS